MRELRKVAKRKAKEMLAEMHDFTWNGEDNKSYNNTKKACLITLTYILDYTSVERNGVIAQDPFWLDVKEEIEKYKD